MNATPTTLDANPFVKSLVFSNHPLYIYPCSPSDESSHSHVLKESSSVFPVHSCVSQGFSFSPNQHAGEKSAVWHEHHATMSPSQNIVPPTNFSSGYVGAGNNTAGTPEFLHPRNTHALQWLMSPPVGGNDPNVMTYTPYATPLQSPITAVSKKLLTPGDFIIPSTTLTPLHSSEVLGDCFQTSMCAIGSCVRNCHANSRPHSCVRSAQTTVTFSEKLPVVSSVVTDAQAATSHCARCCVSCNAVSDSECSNATLLCDSSVPVGSMPTCSLSDSVSTGSPSVDSGIQSQSNCCKMSTNLKKIGGTVEFFEHVFLLSKHCDSVVEFEQALRDSFPQFACTAMLRLLLEFTMSQHFDVKHLSRQIADAVRSEMTNCVADEDKTKMYPIGVFWDIENCCVPTGKSAAAIAEKIRQTFFRDHAEAEFMAVCDINKESRQVIQDLNNAQVNVIHVNATAKNAADDKLRQSIRRYAQTHSAPATVILVTGDCNFISEVSDLRHRHKYFVILIHPQSATQSLIQAANTAVSFEDFVSALPVVYRVREQTYEAYLHVANLPLHVDVNVIRGRLKQLSENCGGKVMRITLPTATVKFHTEELSRRAMKRMNGEDVCGLRIIVQPKRSDLSPHSKHFTPRNRPHQADADIRLRRTPSRPRHLDCNSVYPKPPATRTLSKDCQEVQLTISNIDSKLGVKAIQEAVLKMISEHTVVLNLQIRPHNRFTVMCDVTVPDVIAASCVLQHLHRRKIGSKRILVTISQRLDGDITSLRKELTALFEEEHANVLNFQRLQFLYSHRYQNNLSLDELQMLGDSFAVEDKLHGVYVYLNKSTSRQSTTLCQLHCRSERLNSNSFIKIEIGLREFSAKLHALLHSHNGSLFLDGLEQCYQAEFDVFPYPQDTGDCGVYLEHQISYVPGVQIVDGTPKTIVWSQPLSDAASDTTSEASSTSRSKSSNLLNFSREVIELLKTFPHCCMEMDEFKGAYQKHFGHALRLSMFSDVSELLFAMPYVVQVMGKPPKQLITLTHRTQVKRFTHEIVKILKNSPDKAILVAQLPDMYFKTFKRTWNLRDFGVSVLCDILDDIPEGNICVTGEGDNIVLSLPVRERSSEEIERTNQFAKELVEILKSRPRCRMSFTDFVPAYHRHFGRQCKLSNFGFSKLLDLFEALPHIVEIVDGPDKYLQLTEGERLKVLTSLIIGILRQSDGEMVELPIDRVQANFSHKYGFALVPHHYDCNNVEELLRKLPHALTVSQTLDGTVVVRQAERKPIRLLCAQLLVLMLDMDVDNMEIEQLHQAYRTRYSEGIEPGEYGFISLGDVIKKATSGFAKMDVSSREATISLKPIYQRAKRIRSILLTRGGSMTLGEFNHAYRLRYGRPLDADRHGFKSCEGMLRALSMVLVVKGFGIKKTLTLRNHMQRGPLSASVASSSDTVSTETNSIASSDEPARPPRPLQEIIAALSSPRKLHKFDESSMGNDLANYDNSYRPLQRETHNDLPHRAPPPVPSVIPGGHNPPPDMNTTWSYPTPGSFGAVGSNPCCVYESDISHYHQYQSSLSESRGNDVIDYVTSYGDQYQHFKKSPYQSFSNFTPFNNAGICDARSESGLRMTGDALRELYEQSSDSQSGRRRFNLSVITLPTGTTSISSTPSPESTLSVDEDTKTSSDESRCTAESKKRVSPGRLQLAASFTTPAI